MPLLAAVLAACSSGPDDSAIESPAGEPPPPPLSTAEEAAAAVGIGTQHGLPDVLDLYGTYIGLMELGDEQCPGPGYQLMDSQVPLTGCTSQSGVSYAGVSIVLDEDDLNPGDANFVGRLVGGDFTITDAEGHTLDFGGQVMWMRQRPEGRTSIFSQVSGTFAYPGGNPWLAAGVSAVLDMQVEDPGGGVARLVLSGGLGTEDVDLWFDDLIFDAGVCDSPIGAIDIRDASGAWWTYEIQDRCDGCGTLSYPGLPAEEACIDLSAFYAAAIPMLEAEP